MKQLTTRGPYAVDPSVVEASRTAAPADAMAQSNLAWPATREERIDLRDILAKLWRGRVTILLITGLGALFGYFVITNLTPTYTASAKIMLDTRPLRLSDQPVLPGFSTDAEVVEGEIQVLTSRELAKEVIDVLGLKQSPEFNPELEPEPREETPMETATRYLTDWSWSNFTVYARDLIEQIQPNDGAATDEEDAQRLETQIADAFLDGLAALQVGQAPVIRIEYTSTQPEIAAEIANQVASTYQVQQLGLKTASTRQATERLETNIERLRGQLDAKERDLERYRAESGLVGDSTGLLLERQMNDASSALSVARDELRAATARLQQAQQNPNATLEVLESDLIEDLRVREAEIRRELAQASSELGPNHPRIQTLRGELDELQGNVQDEIAKIIQGLSGRTQAERQRVAQAEANLDQLTVRMAALRESEVEARRLERDVEALRVQLENLAARQQEAQAQQDLQQADARIISYAAVPEDPAAPNKKLLMVAVLFVSGAAGVSIAYLRQALDDRILTLAQLREALGLPVLDLVPSAGRGWLRRTSPVESVVNARTSAFSEGLRHLQVSLFRRASPKTLLFTSPMPGDGKTSLTLAFGRFLALGRRKVIVVDCDIRKSSVHKLMQGRKSPGLVEYLLGDATLDQVIQVDDVTGMKYIASGEFLHNPADLLSSQELHELLTRLGNSHDLVLLDTAPVMAVADTRCLQPLVDQTIFVVKWASTRIPTAREAVRRLQEDGAFGPIAAMLNDVDPKQYQRYDYTYHYSAVKTYYGR